MSGLYQGVAGAPVIGDRWMVWICENLLVCDRNSALECEGVPYVLTSYQIRGKDKKYEKREKQLPLSDEIVRFE